MQQIPTHFHIPLFLLLFFLNLVVQEVSAINDTAIDFSTAPSCARPYCLEDKDSPYIWTPQNLCPSSSSSSILPSCFCNLPRPLICLPYDPTAPDTCYTELKTWYTTLCTSTMGIIPNKTLPYLKLPGCARNCAKAMTSHLGCPDHSLNCACQLTYLPGNTAECIKDRCGGDILTYIGNLPTFTGKWIYQSCAFDGDRVVDDNGNNTSNANTNNNSNNNNNNNMVEVLGIRSDTPEYKNSPAAYPQEILVDDFQGKEYTNWQNALNSKRARNSNLGVIIPLSLIFGGVFGIMGLQWLAACCGFKTQAGRQRWDKAGRLVKKVFGAIGAVFSWIWKGVVILGSWIWKGGKVVWGWVR
ncbi:hypothetical protein TWF788_001089 [Orbilia oligospora]|uniref:CFEM domain-containing protein n=1 Tax=Orbilia oligospora TaxID=2813651 RepID=A0A7C8KIZ2_ORBOL|nr:hypothetical protein TWF788_001089 [Orbilia oligospora]